jgi:uracil-DNA glycosylase
MMPSDLLNNYLSWQGEIGGDEVILPHPFRRKSSPGSGEARTLESQSSSVFQHAPAFQPTSASNLFGDLARGLEAKEKTEKFVLALPPSSTPTPARIVEAVQYPVFSGMEEFKDYLSKHSRTVFTSESDIQLIHGIGNLQAPLALVSLEPNDLDISEARLFAGEAGILLEKMMRAIHLNCQELYRSSLLKHRAPTRIWSRREISRILPLLHIELSLIQAPIVLLLGEACAQAVLKTTKTIAELRQIPHREGGKDFVVTYHPDELLRRDELKRKAWEDLQWLQRRMNLSQAQV